MSNLYIFVSQSLQLIIIVYYIYVIVDNMRSTKVVLVVLVWFGFFVASFSEVRQIRTCRVQTCVIIYQHFILVQ